MEVAFAELSRFDLVAAFARIEGALATPDLTSTARRSLILLAGALKPSQTDAGFWSLARFVSDPANQVVFVTALTLSDRVRSLSSGSRRELWLDAATVLADAPGLIPATGPEAPGQGPLVQATIYPEVSDRIRVRSFLAGCRDWCRTMLVGRARELFVLSLEPDPYAGEIVAHWALDPSPDPSRATVLQVLPLLCGASATPSARGLLAAASSGAELDATLCALATYGGECLGEPFARTYVDAPERRADLLHWLARQPSEIQAPLADQLLRVESDPDTVGDVLEALARHGPSSETVAARTPHYQLCLLGSRFARVRLNAAKAVCSLQYEDAAAVVGAAAGEETDPRVRTQLEALLVRLGESRNERG